MKGGFAVSALLTDLGTVVTSVFGWVGTVATTITTTPLLGVSRLITFPPVT